MAPTTRPKASLVNDNSAIPLVGIGYHSATGPRPRNEDFVGAVLGSRAPEARRDVAAAVADGIGSAKGGRVAAETAVRGFLDGFWDVPETMEVRRAAARVLDSLNAWIHAQGQNDPDLTGMGLTFTALVLRGRYAHLLHVGDTRAYRLSGDRLLRLTTDHVRDDRTKIARALSRARHGSGIAPGLRQSPDGAARSLSVVHRWRPWLRGGREHRRYSARALGALDTGGKLVETALESGSTDNCTALVLDVVALPMSRSDEVGSSIMSLPLIPCRRSAIRWTASCLTFWCPTAPTAACSVRSTRWMAERWY